MWKTCSARGRVLLAVERCREGKAPLGRAAEMAGISVAEMLDLLERHGVAANLTVGDYRESLSNLREIW